MNITLGAFNQKVDLEDNSNYSGKEKRAYGGNWHVFIRNKQNEIAIVIMADIKNTEEDIIVEICKSALYPFLILTSPDWDFDIVIPTSLHKDIFNNSQYVDVSIVETNNPEQAILNSFSCLEKKIKAEMRESLKDTIATEDYINNNYGRLIEIMMNNGEIGHVDGLTLSDSFSPVFKKSKIIPY